MKKIITIIAIMAIGYTAAAQKKGQFAFANSIYIDGGTNISSVKGDGDNIRNTRAKNTLFTIGTGIDYFVMDNLAITGRIKYGLYNAGGRSDHTFTVAPGARYYVPLVANKFFYTPGANISMGLETSFGDVGFTCGLNLDLAMLEFRPIERLGLTLSLASFSWNMATYATVDRSSGTPIIARETDHSIRLNGSCVNIGVGIKFYF